MPTLKPMTPPHPLIRANVKPPSPLLAPELQPLKPTTPMQPKTTPKTAFSHPQRRWRFQPHTHTSEQRRQGFHARDFRCRWEVAGPGCGTRGRWRGLAGLRADALRHTSATRHHRCGGHRRDRRARLRQTWAVAGPRRASSRRAEPHISDQAPPVWRAPEGAAAVPVGGGGAWPGFELTRRAFRLAARTASGRAAAHRHTQRPGPPAPGTPAGPQAPPEIRRGRKHRRKVRTPRSTPGFGRPGGRRGGPAR